MFLANFNFDYKNSVACVHPPLTLRKIGRGREDGCAQAKIARRLKFRGPDRKWSLMAEPIKNVAKKFVTPS